MPARFLQRLVRPLAVILFVASCTPMASREIYQVPNDIAGPAPANAVAEVARLVNAERVKYGLRPLAPNGQLMRAAQSHARYMAVKDCYEHRCPGEPALGDRARKSGYSYRKITENIHAAQLEPQRVVAGWMASPPHRRNILDPTVTEIGVGHAYLPQDGGRLNHHHYWVANFATPL